MALTEAEKQAKRQEEFAAQQAAQSAELDRIHAETCQKPDHHR